MIAGWNIEGVEAIPEERQTPGDLQKGQLKKWMTDVLNRQDAISLIPTNRAVPHARDKRLPLANEILAGGFENQFSRVVTPPTS
jgi:hypothetical protein